MVPVNHHFLNCRAVYGTCTQIQFSFPLLTIFSYCNITFLLKVELDEDIIYNLHPHKRYIAPLHWLTAYNITDDNVNVCTTLNSYMQYIRSNEHYSFLFRARFTKMDK